MFGGGREVGDWTAVMCRILKFSSMLSCQPYCRSLANGSSNALRQSETYFSTVHVIRLHLAKGSLLALVLLWWLVILNLIFFWVLKAQLLKPYPHAIIS